jgi:hypothetical protein
LCSEGLKPGIPSAALKAEQMRLDLGVARFPRPEIERDGGQLVHDWNGQLVLCEIDGFYA